MRDGDRPGGELGPHLHRDDETLYIVEGSLAFSETETGETHHRTLVPFDEHVLPAK